MFELQPDAPRAPKPARRPPVRKDKAVELDKCTFCKRAIDPAKGERSVTCGGGPQHAECVPLQWAAVQASIDQAKAEGRHSDARLHACADCRRWVPSLAHRRLDGKLVCHPCSPAGRAEAEKRAKEQRQREGGG